MPEEPAIFISYRRRDAGGHGRALHEYLSGRFGDDRVFFDRSTIESGDVFPDTLRQGVEGCAVLLALIGPEWLDVRGDDGGRRLDDEDDFVRREITLALKQGKKVIPVLFDDTPVPPRSRLPDPLAALASCDALTLRGKTYEYQTQRRELVRLLAKVPGMPEPLPEAGEAVAAIPAGLLDLIRVATVPLQQLNQEHRETIRVLERQLGASEAQLHAFFQIIGEAQVPPEQQPARLVEIAAQYRQLRAQMAALPGDAPEVARLKDTAWSSLDAGRLQQADDLLVQVEAAQDAVLDRRQREIERQPMERAATAAQRAGIALMRLRYREAARLFGEAASIVAEADRESRWRHRLSQAIALYKQGLEFGDNDSLREAIEVLRDWTLPLVPRIDAPLEWAMTQNNLGSALSTLGERESGTARLEEAVEAYRAVLEEYTRERAPLEWATVQNGLGLALARLGERKEYTRERSPLDWAMTQNNLGLALARLGARKWRGTEHLEEAVATFRLALEELTRERAPLDWAMTQNNLACALQSLGARKGTEHLEEAVATFRLALEEYTRERAPLKWAMVQNNLGNALASLGARKWRGTEHLEEAVATFRLALEELTRERAPLDWAQTQYNLGVSLHTLAAREWWGAFRHAEFVAVTARLEEAVEAYEAALKIFKATHTTHYIEITQVNLAKCQADISHRRRLQLHFKFDIFVFFLLILGSIIWLFSQK